MQYCDSHLEPLAGILAARIIMFALVKETDESRVVPPALLVRR